MPRLIPRQLGRLTLPAKIQLQQTSFLSALPALSGGGGSKRSLTFFPRTIPDGFSRRQSERAEAQAISIQDFKSKVSGINTFRHKVGWK
jgi:hypothetical protein